MYSQIIGFILQIYSPKIRTCNTHIFAGKKKFTDLNPETMDVYFRCNREKKRCINVLKTNTLKKVFAEEEKSGM